MKFVIYTKENCVYCKQVKQVFKLKDLDYEEYTLGEDFDKESFVKKFGNGTTFPQVILDESVIGGASDTIKYLKKNNII